MIIIEFILLIVFLNVIPLFNFVKFPVVITIAVSVLYLFILFRKEKIPVKNFRLRMIKSGTKLIRLAVSAVIPEAVILCIFLRYINGPILIGASISFAVVFILVTLIVGMIKTAVGSKQIKITDHIDNEKQEKDVAKVVGQVIANDIKKDKTIKPEKKKK